METNFPKNHKTGRIILRDIVPEKTEVILTKKTIIPKTFKKTPEIKPKTEEKKSVIIARPETKSKFRRLAYPVFFVFSFSLVIFALAFFSSATVKITPKLKKINVSRTFSAFLEKGEIGLEKFTIAKTTKDGLPTSLEKDIEQRASGKITIFNAYSSSPQVLTVNTRFESPEGKIFRISKRVVIPGAKISAGKIEPASLAAIVYAEKSGREYNISPGLFTIPGFKGTDKYEKFYAVSENDFSGGFKGRAKIATPEDIKKLKDKITERLGRELENEFSKKIISGFLELSNTKTAVFEEISVFPKADERGETVEMEIRGELKAFLISEKDLEKQLGETYAPGMKLTNLKDLKIETEKADISAGNAEFRIQGEAEFIFLSDKEALANDLKGRKTDEIKEIFSRHSEIEKAEVILRPSFIKILPRTPERIKIIEEIK